MQPLHVPNSTLMSSIMCQHGCKAEGKAHHQALKDTSTESGADVLPAGGVHRHSPHVPEQISIRDNGVVVPSGKAASLPARWLERVDNQHGTSSLHQVEPPPPWENKVGTEWLQAAASLVQIYRGILMPEDIWRPGVQKTLWI